MPKSSGRKRNKREADEQERLRNSRQENRTNQNIGETERVMSNILGGMLLIGGLGRRSWTGVAIAAAGAAFLYRGATGHCMVYESLGLDASRGTMNSYHASDHALDPPQKTAQLKNSGQAKEPSTKLKRMEEPKAMTGKNKVRQSSAVSHSKAG